MEAFVLFSPSRNPSTEINIFPAEKSPQECGVPALTEQSAARKLR